MAALLFTFGSIGVPSALLMVDSVTERVERLSETEVLELRKMLLEYHHRRWAMRQIWIFGGVSLSVMTGMAAVYTAFRTFMGIK